MASKRYKLRIVIRGAAVVQVDAAIGDKRADAARVLLVDTGSDTHPKGGWSDNCKAHGTHGKHVPPHYPYLSLPFEDQLRVPRSRLLPAADGRYHHLVPLARRSVVLGDGEDRSVRLDWSREPLDSPTDEKGKKVLPFGAMDWTLDDRVLKLEVDPSKKLGSVELPGGKLRSAHLLRYRAPGAGHPCILWRVLRDGHEVARQAVADAVVLESKLYDPLTVTVTDPDGREAKYALDPRPAKRLDLSITNVPAFVCDPDTVHLQMYNGISSGQAGDFTMDKGDLDHPGGACPPVRSFTR